MASSHLENKKTNDKNLKAAEETSPAVELAQLKHRFPAAAPQSKDNTAATKQDKQKTVNRKGLNGGGEAVWNEMQKILTLNKV